MYENGSLLLWILLDLSGLHQQRQLGNRDYQVRLQQLDQLVLHQRLRPGFHLEETFRDDVELGVSKLFYTISCIHRRVMGLIQKSLRARCYEFIVRLERERIT